MIFLNIFILYFTIIICIHFFKIFKIYDQRHITKKYDYILQNKIKITKNHDILHKLSNNSNIYQYGIFKSHPFKHPNDIDYYLAELRNGMTILDVGWGLLEASIYFSKKLPKCKIHVISNSNEKYKNEINNNIIKHDLSNKIIPHFDHYHNIGTIFNKKSLDRILFIESINYSDDILNLLIQCKKILRKNGKIYIRTIVIPKTKNQFFKNNYDIIQKNINSNLYYHENIIHFMQKSGFTNIKYTTIPLFFSQNMNNPMFLLSLRRLGLLSISNLIAGIPLMSATYIGTNNN